MSRTKAFFAVLARHDLLLSFLFLSGYFLFLLPDIRLPGLNADEASVGLETAAILRIEKMADFRPETPFREGFLPIMENPYTSNLTAYLLLPFARIFGLNLRAIRLLSVTLSFLSLIYVYLLIREWFGKMTAAAALALIMSSPIFVIYHKLGLSRNEVYLALFYWAGLYHWHRFYARQSRAHLVAAAFWVGLGLNKITFLWYILGSLAAAAVLHKRLDAKRLPKPGDWLCAISAFCAGNILMLYYNLRTGFNTVSFMLAKLRHPTIYGVGNLSYLTNLKIRFGQLVELMVEEHNIGVGVGCCNLPSPNALILAGALVVLLIMVLTKRIDPQRRDRMIYLLVVFVSILLLSPFTVSNLMPQHLYALFFLPPIIITAVLGTGMGTVPFRKTAASLAGVMLAVMLAFNAVEAAYAVREARRTGGSCDFSSAVNDLAYWLDEHKVAGPVVVSSIGSSIPFLTQGRVSNVIERQWFSPEDFGKIVEAFLAQKPDVYLVEAPKCGQEYYEKELAEIRRHAKSLGRSSSVAAAFDDWAGQPEFILDKIARRK